MDPITGMAIGTGINALGGVLSGNGQPDPETAGDLHLVNQGQQTLWNRMMQQYMGGAGDFGMGQNIKAGKSQLAQMMASRGINPGGGTGMGAFANMVGTAGAQANQSRLNFGMNLLRSPMQVAQSAGSNWLPESPSMGYDSTAQWKTSARNTRNQINRTGIVPGTGGQQQFSFPTQQQQFTPDQIASGRRLGRG